MADRAATSPSLWFLAALPAVWLMPQHYLPWLAAHQDLGALLLLVLAGLLVRGPAALPLAWALGLAAALASIGAQALFGPIVFGGDAWMAALYVLAFGGAIATGQAAAHDATAGRGRALDVLALGTVAAAIASTAIALMQWTDTRWLPVTVAALLPGDRPYGNFAQANNFSTALFLGLCSLCWLRESQRIGRLGWTLSATLLLFGMAMSGSRTGWLQVVLAAALLAWRGRAGPEPILRLPHALALVAGLVGLSLAWPLLNEALDLAGHRSAADQVQAGLRLPIWQLSLEALSRQPWWGWGWQQVPAAQLAVALDLPPLQRHIEHSHNIVLDLMLWAGVPVGGLIAACGALALWGQARRLADPRALWLMAGALGVVVHGLLEFPLEYAYLLLPLGVALGVVQALCPGQTALPLPRWAIQAGSAALGAMLLLTAVDYFEVEQNYRTARLETTFGERRITTSSPELRVLSQLEAFMRLIRVEPRPGMTAAELDALRAASTRYPYLPALIQLATSEGLNGRPEAAHDALRRLCAMQPPRRCEQARLTWQDLQARHPALATVPPPEIPGKR